MQKTRSRISHTWAPLTRYFISNVEVRDLLSSKAMLRIRIRSRIGSDPHQFAGWGSGSGHADPDPADPDRYQFQTHVFFWFDHFLHFRWMQQVHPAATYHFTSPLSQVCHDSVGRKSSQWTVPLMIYVPGHVGVVGLLLSRSTELLKVRHSF